LFEGAKLSSGTEEKNNKDRVNNYDSMENIRTKKGSFIAILSDKQHIFNGSLNNGICNEWEKKLIYFILIEGEQPSNTTRTHILKQMLSITLTMDEGDLAYQFFCQCN